MPLELKQEFPINYSVNAGVVSQRVEIYGKVKCGREDFSLNDCLIVPSANH